MTDFLTIAGKQYQSRLLVGSGKYKDLPREYRPGPEGAVVAGCLPPSQYSILPNTAGCYNIS